MSITGKIKQIGRELRIHAPFTLIGAASGIVFMLLGRVLLKGHEASLFAVFHPAHVLLSAMVTAALFEIHRRAKSFILILIVGIVGAIGIATLSDCILPFFGEDILGVAIPTHADLHTHDHGNEEMVAENIHDHNEHEGHDHQAVIEDEDHTDHDGHDHDEHVHEDEAYCPIHDEVHRPSLHLGFVEEWYLVFPAAILGVLLAYFKPATKLPHATHVLLSTWASSAHILMNTHAEMTGTLLLGMLIVLFIAVWLPCCVSDIIFPLLFVRSDGAHVGHSCCFLCGKKEPEGDEHESESD